MIQDFANWLIYDFLAISADTHLGQALNFFFYDSIKIIFLLFFITIIMGVINFYMPVAKLRNYLTTRNLYGFQYFFASVFGAITPFCSCSSIPLFIAFIKGGIPLGVTFSFLIASPIINEVAIAVFAATFGWKVTLIYVSSGLFLGTTGGFLLGKMGLDKYLSDWAKDSFSLKNDSVKFNSSFCAVLPRILKEAMGITQSVLPYVLIGIALGAVMHGYVPEGFFENYLGTDSLLSVPVAVLLAVPMYANAAGIVPVIEVFVAKGVALGTALSFMIAVVGLSLPEAILLKKIMKPRLILIFYLTISIFIIILGYFFNFIFV